MKTPGLCWGRGRRASEGRGARWQPAEHRQVSAVPWVPASTALPPQSLHRLKGGRVGSQTLQCSTWFLWSACPSTEEWSSTLQHIHRSGHHRPIECHVSEENSIWLPLYSLLSVKCKKQDTKFYGVLTHLMYIVWLVWYALCIWCNIWYVTHTSWNPHIQYILTHSLYICRILHM